MSEARFRKKIGKEASKQTRTGSTPNHRSSSRGAGASPLYLSNQLLWIPLVVAVLIYSYLYPSIIRGFLNEWVGFSENYDSAPAAHQPHVTHLYADFARRDAVVRAFQHSWHAYERDAMGDDEYHPLSQKGTNLTKAGGVGYMVVDVLDSLYLMGLTDEYHRARDWVAQSLSFEQDDTFSLFETTIRILGGLLSAYNLSGGDNVFLEKAVDLADRMIPAFETTSGLPLPLINLAQRKGYHTTDFPGFNSVAEVATLQLEFKYLSYLVGDEDYWRRVEKVMKVVEDARLPHGLASTFLSIEEGEYYTSVIRLGSRGDSFYEYLLKQYLQTNSYEGVYREMYDSAMSSIHEYLVQTSMGNKMIYTSELVPENGPNGELEWRLTPKQDHLVCFLGGSLMLGAIRTGALVDHVSTPPRPGELSESGMRDWKTGVELIKTCMNTHDTATGLAPEIVYFRVPSDGMDQYQFAPADWYIKGAAPGVPPPYDARYMLRPETVESLFIAYRLTGDEIYRERGWRIFQAIEKHCRVESGGYATVLNVDEVPARLEDKMETFFLSETLKYLFLLFEDSDMIPLDKYVFNTEAHPLPIFSPPLKTGFS